MKTGRIHTEIYVVYMRRLDRGRIHTKGSYMLKLILFGAVAVIVFVVAVSLVSISMMKRNKDDGYDYDIFS
ncbi:hypothetical protein PM3016_1013 [Paenibacillus mucilaginosus 3016]|uniref:Uncharacterized protein n=3 Tax=Paenibacillus mucilaginosus TaxID=61624 RepID=H6N9E6_9BACL|nr:hypothetical protein PM3016_1013 [Paenibacillus mucilaginosus 3016]